MAHQNNKKEIYQSQRNQHHELLMGLKSTVEGLLATQTSNVWSTYGGLDRVCLQLERILTHRLLDKSESNDFWPFIKEVKWEDPVLDPFIEGINRSTSEPDGFSKGQIWLRQSLHQHTVSSQLNTLVNNRELLQKHYHEDAFLCNPKYVQALLICLHSIERNKVTLLAEINPVLLTLKSKLDEAKTCEGATQSAPLPIRKYSTAKMYNEMERKKKEKTPPYASPKRVRALLGYSQAQAVPITSSEEIGGRAKDAMRSVLDRSGTNSPSKSPTCSFSFYDSINSDPLLNFEFTGTHSELSLSTSHLACIEGKPRECYPVESKDLVDGKTSGISTRQNPKKSNPLAKSVSLEEQSCDLSASMQENNPIRNCKPADVLPAIPPTTAPNSEQVSAHVPQKVEPVTSSLKPSHKRCQSDIPFVKESHTMPRRASLLPTKSNSFSTDDKSTQRKAVYQYPAYGPNGHLTHPTQGQSLMSFLSSQDFHTCANLDRENAHFSISEILISAIEQMKWKHVIAPPNSSDLEDGDSDEEIQRLKQRIRIRRRERMKEKARGFPAFSDGRTDTPSPSAGTSSSTNTSSNSSSPCTSMLPLLQSDSSESSDGIDDQEIELSITDRSENSSLLKSSGLSLSMASLYSDADLFQRNIPVEKLSFGSTFESCNSSQVSAESVAISLLKKFSEKQLPKASDLQWMESEKDAPQTLLPLQTSYPNLTDDGADYTDLRNRTRLRGNLEWAPPRPQIIFSIHSSAKRSVAIPKQNYRCAGCGTRVEPAYMKRFRYCEYLGKYFCQCCHTNASAFIPGRILQKWDFSKYYVSKFSHDLLVKVFNEPFYNLEDINSVLYRKVKVLESIKQFRQQLVHLATLMKICKHACTTIYPEIEKLPTHIVREIHTYSIADLLRVKNGELLPLLKNIVTAGISHVKECQYCPCLGFICELCNNEHDIIFPFQISKAINCPDCKACYHQSCFIPNKCPKCARIAMRKKLQQQRSMDIEEEENG